LNLVRGPSFTTFTVYATLDSKKAISKQQRGSI
jgi:hypothetical protein